jgi:O-antigen ligase
MVSKRPSGDRLVLTVGLLVAGTSGALYRVSIGGVTGLAVASTLLLGMLAIATFARPKLARRGISLVVTLGLLAIWAVAATGLNGHFDVAAAQNLVALGAFSLTLVISSRLALIDTHLVYMDRVFLVASCALVVLYVLPHALGLDVLLFHPRVFALTAVAFLTWGLGRWFVGGWVKKLMSLSLLLLVIVSLSRTAAAVGVLLVAVVYALHGAGKRRFALRSVMVLGSGVGLASFLIRTDNPFSERLFTGDMSLSILGLQINAMGRGEMWSLVWDSAQASPFLGAGAGSAQRAITAAMGAAIEHPHNDYLRLLHDYGMVGLGLFLALMALAAILLKRSIASSGDADELSVAIAGVNALIVLAVSMITDNVLVYVGALMPIAAVLGTGVTRHLPDDAGPRPKMDRLQDADDRRARAPVGAC